MKVYELKNYRDKPEPEVPEALHIGGVVKRQEKDSPTWRYYIIVRTNMSPIAVIAASLRSGLSWTPTSVIVGNMQSLTRAEARAVLEFANVSFGDWVYVGEIEDFVKEEMAE